MRYKLKENAKIDLNGLKILYVAKRIGVHQTYLSNVLRGKVTTTKAVAFYIIHIAGGEEEDIEKYFDLVE